MKLENGSVEVDFGRTGAISSLRNRKTGTEYVTAPAPRLWSLVVRGGDSYETVGSDRQECEARTAADAITLVYPRVRGAHGDLGLGVTCVVRLVDDELRFAATLESSGGRPVEELQYPMLGGCAGLAGKPHWLYWPEGGGQRFPDPELSPERRRIRYPRASMQWMEYAGKDEGLYIGSHDSSLETTFLEATTCGKSLFFAVTKHPFLRSAGAWKSAEYVISPHCGDWHVGADKYRRWAESWMRMSDPPEWARDCVGWLLVIMKQQNGDIMWRYRDIPLLVDIARRSGLDTVGLFGWATGGHDHLYPDYVPDPEMGGEEQLRAGIREARARGGRVILYTNGQLIDTIGPWFEREGKRIAARRPDGNHYFEQWRKYSDHPGYLHAVACQSTPQWRARLLELADQMRDLGANGLLYDQLGAGSGADLCFATDHSHDRPSNAIGPGIAANLAAVQAHVRARDPEFIVMTEHVGDAMCQSIDLIHGCGPSHRCLPTSFPGMFRYAFPEYAHTNRWGSQSAPVLDTTEANFAFVHGIRTDIECRYPGDAEWLRSGRRPTDADYAAIPTSPDVTMMREGPLEDYQRYLKQLNDLRRSHPILLRGRYRDDQGFAIDNPELVARLFVAEGAEPQAAIVVWNPGRKAQKFAVTLPGHRLVCELRPGGGRPGTALRANRLAVLLFEKA